MRRSRPTRRIDAVAFVAALLVAACGRSSAPAPRPAVDATAAEAWPAGICSGDGWCWAHPRPTGAKLNRLWGTGPSDVWAVGEGGTILHFDGTRWSRVPSGTANSLLAIGGRAAGDAWAIGNRRTLLRLSGGAWRPVELPKLEEEEELADLLVLPNGEAWIVGGATKKSRAGEEIVSRCLIGHTEGGAAAAWRLDEDGDCGPLGRVWGASPDDVWADGGSVVHWNGRYLTVNPKKKPAPIIGRHGYAGGWKLALDWGGGGIGPLVDPRRPKAGPGDVRDFWAWGPDEVWAISKDGSLMHFDGKRWSRGDDPVSLRAVAARAADDVWAIGADESLLHFDGHDWRSSRLSGISNRSLLAIAAPATQGADRELWVLTRTDLLHFDGKRWASIVAGPRWTFESFVVRGPRDVWVAAGTKVLDWNGQAVETFDVDFDARRIFGDARELWAGWPLHRMGRQQDGHSGPEAAGTDGKGLHFAGGAMGGGALWLAGGKRISRLAGGRLDVVKDLPVKDQPRLDAIWVTPSGEIWAGGTHIVHGKGDSWTVDERFGTADITSVGGADGLVWALLSGVTGCPCSGEVRSGRAPEHHMRRCRGGHVRRRDVVAERALHVDPLEQRLARAKQQRRDREVQLVHLPRAQVLPDGRRAAADTNVGAAGGLARAPERLLDPAGDEVERRPALHLQRRPRVVREHEHRHVVGRVLAPPAAPLLVGPGTAHRPEHVAAQDPGADVLGAAAGEVIVGTRGALARQPRHALEGPRREEPLVQADPVAAERVLLVLQRSGTVPVERDGEAADA